MKEYHGKYASNSKSRAKIYEQFVLKTRKEFCIKCRLEQAAKAHNAWRIAQANAGCKSRWQHVISAHSYIYNQYGFFDMIHLYSISNVLH